jgi:hypothetical protein
MKNIQQYHSKFNRLDKGLFEITRKVSTLQFLLGFIFPLIPMGIIIANHHFLIEIIIKGIKPTKFNIEGFTIFMDYQFGNSTITNYSINILANVVLLYVAIALAVRNIFFKNQKQIIKLDNQQKRVYVSINGQSFIIPFSEFSHFNLFVDTEMSGNEGGSPVKIYFVYMHKKDGEIYELLKTNNPKRAENVLEMLNTEIDFNVDENHKETFYSLNNLQKFSFKNPLVWQNKVKWYFWTNCVGFLIIVYYLLSLIISIGKDEINIFLIVVGLLIVPIGLYIVYLLSKKSIQQLQNSFELKIDSDKIVFSRIRKSNGQKIIINEIPLNEILLVRQMGINADYFVGNFAIAILSKKDEAVLQKESEVFTKKFNHSIGFIFENEDYVKSVALENYIQQKCNVHI